LKIFTNFSWLFFDKVLRIFLGLFISAWVARYLGPENFGLLNYAVAIVSLASPFADMGLQSIVVRDLSQKKLNSGSILGSALVIMSFGTLLSLISIGMYLIYGTVEDSLLRNLILIFGSAVLFRLSEIFKYWFESQIESKYVIWIQSTVFLCISLIKVYLILNAYPIEAFAMMFLLDSFFCFLGLIFIYQKREMALLSWSVNWRYARELILESWPLVLSGMVLMVQARIDQIMLGEMISKSEVGYYSVSLAIIEGLSFVPMILMSSLAPSIAKVKKISEEIYQTRLRQYYSMNFLLFLCIAIPLALLSEFIVKVLFGNSFIPAGSILTLMTLRLFFANMGVARHLFIVNNKLIKYSFFTMLAGVFVNILMNYLLIPSLKSHGALIASYLSFFTTIFLIDFFYKETSMNCRLMLSSMNLFKINFRELKSVIFSGKDS